MPSKGDIRSTARRFRTFAGVFTPSFLTLLGIILFLRVGWVLGNAGFWGAVAIIVLAHIVTFATALSLSAIATNVEAKTGGAYYLISRSLGLELGGSIGITLYLSQAVSVAFYIIGFSEVVRNLIPQIPPQITSTLVCLGFAYLAYRGAGIAIKVQYVIMALLILSLLSFFLGGSSSAVPIHYDPNYVQGYGFWLVFAVFFPAAVGITSGVSMSGDLKKPEWSIPVGTILSIVAAFAIYISVTYWLSVNATTEELITNEMIMFKIAKVPFLIIVGVFASTLSSALACIVAAPRTLTALSYDHIIPSLFARTMGSATEPRMGVLVTFIIAEAVILLGNLNAVAPVITMFFLNTYGMINLAAGFERMTGNPSYRPKFKVHWSISMFGAFCCYCAMFLIHAGAAVIAVVVSYFIFFLLERRSLNRTWGDIRSGLWFSLARFALLKLEGYKWHPKNWKPNILVFSGNPQSRANLVDLAKCLGRGNGMISLYQLMVGKTEEAGGKEGMRTLAYKNLKRFIEKNDIEAFPHADVVNNFEEGVLTVVQAHGVGWLRPNTALFGWSDKTDGQVQLLRLVKRLSQLNRSALILKSDEEAAFGEKKLIKVWWGGRSANDDMKLLLSHLISLDPSWSGSKVRVMTVIDDPDGKQQAEQSLIGHMKKNRLDEDVTVIVRERPDQLVREVIRGNSDDADLVVLGIDEPELGKEAEHAANIDELTKPLGACLLVKSAEAEELI